MWWPIPVQCFDSEGLDLVPDNDNQRDLNRFGPPQSRAPLAVRIQKYYQQPDPGALRDLFDECWTAGLFRFKNGRPNPITLTFFAAALDATGEAGWEGFIDDMLSERSGSSVGGTGQGWLARRFGKAPRPDERRNALLVIAFLCKDREQRALRYFLKRTLPPETELAPQLALLETDLAGMRPKAALDNPLQLDQLWAFFYATGNENALRGVIAVANGDAIATPEVLRGTAFNREAIMQGAAYSLIELAPKQPRISQIIYAALEDYQDGPVYPVLIMALERAGVARLSTNPDGTSNISFEIPPEWQ